MDVVEGVVSVFLSVGLFSVPFVFVILIVRVVSNNNRKKSDTQIQTIRDVYIRAIENGMDRIVIPENLFPQPKKGNPLKTGIIFLAIGIGITLAMVFLAIPEGKNILPGLAAGVLPICIGLGFLVVYFLQQRQETSVNEK